MIAAFLKRGIVLSGILAAVLALATSTVAVPPVPQSSQVPTNPAAAQRALLDQYCVTCHNQQLKTAGLLLDKADLNDIPGGAAIWEKVVMKLRSGMMPPLGRPKPDQGSVDAMVTMLEHGLDKASLANPEPGRASLHRLNRTEYGNAIRDLLGLDIDVKELL